MAYNLPMQVSLQIDQSTITSLRRQIESGLGGIQVQGLDTKNFAKANAQIEGTAKNLRKGQGAAESFFDALEGRARGFVAYTIASTAILKLSNVVAGATREAIKFETELIKISQVTNQTTQRIVNQSQVLVDISKKYNITISKVALLTRTLTQTGLSFKEASKGAEILARTSLLATFDSLTNTTEGLIAVMQTFNLTVQQSGVVLDKINSVSKAFAVESSDIVEAIRRTGGAFSSAGGQIEELIALFTSVRSTTRESAETIATGFRTIFGRLQRPKTIEYFKQLGIQLETAEGQFIGPLAAIEEIGKGLDRLGIKAGSVKFAEVVEQIGGIRQISRVIPLLEQYQKTQRALEIQNNASGESAKDLEKAQKGLGYQLGTLKQDFTSLINEVVNSDSFKFLAETFINFTKTIISLTKALKPLLPLLTAVLTVKIGRGLTQLTTGGFSFKGMKEAIGFAGGGMVPGSGNSDTVPAMLTPGEFVIRKSAVQAFGADRLSKINKYAAGGWVTLDKVKYDNPQAKKPKSRPGKKAIEDYQQNNDKANDKDLIKSDFKHEVISATFDDQTGQFSPASGFSSKINWVKIVESLAGYKGNIFTKSAEQFEEEIGRLTGMALTSQSRNDPNYPIDLEASGRLAEVRMRKTQTDYETYLSKILRAKIDQQSADLNQFAKIVSEDPDEVDLKDFEVYETDPKGKQAFNNWVNYLGRLAQQERRDALKAYTGQGSVPVNKFLSGKPIHKSQQKSVLNIIENLEKLMDDDLPATLYTGFGQERLSIIDKLKTPGGAITDLIDKIVTFPGFLSSSDNLQVAKTFVRKGMMTIDTSGKKGIDVGRVLQGRSKDTSSLSMSDLKKLGAGYQEAEFILPRNSSFKIISAAVQDGEYAIALQMLAKGGKAKRPSVNEVGSQIAEEFNLAKGKNAYNQLENNCLSIARKVADMFGYNTDPDSIRKKIDLFQQIRSPFGIKPTPEILAKSSSLRKLAQNPTSADSTGNIVVREGEEMMRHVSFEHMNKEYNFGAAGEDWPIVLRIPLTKKEQEKAYGGIIQKFAKGGSVGTDTVPALLTPGEFVINKQSAQSFGYGNLERINRYADGGYVDIQEFKKGGKTKKAERTLSAKERKEMAERYKSEQLDTSLSRGERSGGVFKEISAKYDKLLKEEKALIDAAYQEKIDIAKREGKAIDSLIYQRDQAKQDAESAFLRSSLREMEDVWKTINEKKSVDDSEGKKAMSEWVATLADGVANFKTSIAELIFYQQSAAMAFKNFLGVTVNQDAIQASAVRAGQLDLTRSAVNQIDDESLKNFSDKLKNAGSLVEKFGGKIGGKFGGMISKTGGWITKLGGMLTKWTPKILMGVKFLGTALNIASWVELFGGLFDGLMSIDYKKVKEQAIERGDVEAAGAAAAKQYNQEFYRGIPIVGGLLSAFQEYLPVVMTELDARGKLIVSTAELSASINNLDKVVKQTNEDFNEGLRRGDTQQISSALSTQADAINDLFVRAEQQSDKIAKSRESSGLGGVFAAATGGAVAGAGLGAAAGGLPSAGIGAIPGAIAGAVIGFVGAGAYELINSMSKSHEAIMESYQKSGEAYEKWGKEQAERINIVGDAMIDAGLQVLKFGGSVEDAFAHMKGVFGEDNFKSIFGDFEPTADGIEKAYKKQSDQSKKYQQSIDALQKQMDEAALNVDAAWEPTWYNFYQGSKKAKKETLASLEDQKKKAEAEKQATDAIKAEIAEMQQKFNLQIALNKQIEIENAAMKERVLLSRELTEIFDRLNRSSIAMSQALEAANAAQNGSITGQQILENAGITDISSDTLGMDANQILRDESAFNEMSAVIGRLGSERASQMMQETKTNLGLVDQMEALMMNGKLGRDIAEIRTQASEEARRSMSGGEDGGINEGAKVDGTIIADKIEAALKATNPQLQITPRLKEALQEYGNDIANGMSEAQAGDKLRQSIGAEAIDLIRSSQEKYNEYIQMEKEYHSMKMQLNERNAALYQSLYNVEKEYFEQRIALTEKLEDFLDPEPTGAGRAGFLAARAQQRRQRALEGIRSAREKSGVLSQDTRGQEKGLIASSKALGELARNGENVSEMLSLLQQEGQLLLSTLKDEISAEQDYLDGLIETAKAQQEYTQALNDAQGDLIRDLVTGTEDEQADLLNNLNAAMVAAQQGSFAGIPEELKKQVFSIFDQFGDVEIPGLGMTGRDAQREITKNELMMNWGLDEATANKLASKTVKDRVPIDERMKQMIELQEQKILELLAREKALKEALNAMEAASIMEFSKAVDRFAAAIDKFLADLRNPPPQQEQKPEEAPEPPKQQEPQEPPKSAIPVEVTNWDQDGGRQRHEALPVDYDPQKPNDNLTPEERFASDPKAQERAARASAQVQQTGNGGVRNPVQAGGWERWWNDTLDTLAYPANYLFGTNPTAGYAKGGIVYAANGGPIDISTMFKPKGTDTVPAMLTKGEYVIRKTAVDKIGVDTLDELNRGSPVYAAKGGKVGYYNQGGYSRTQANINRYGNSDPRFEQYGLRGLDPDSPYYEEALAYWQQIMEFQNAYNQRAAYWNQGIAAQQMQQAQWIMGMMRNYYNARGYAKGGKVGYYRKGGLVDLSSQAVDMFGSDFAKRLAKDFNLDEKMLKQAFKPSSVLGGDAGSTYLDDLTTVYREKLNRDFTAGAAVDRGTNRLVGRGGSIRADILQHELGHVAQNNLLNMNNVKGADVLRGKDKGMQGLIEAFLKDKKGYEALKGNYLGGKAGKGMYAADEIGNLSHEMFTELLKTYGSSAYKKNKGAQNLLGEFFKQSGLQKQAAQKPSMARRAGQGLRSIGSGIKGAASSIGGKIQNIKASGVIDAGKSMVSRTAGAAGQRLNDLGSVMNSITGNAGGKIQSIGSSIGDFAKAGTGKSAYQIGRFLRDQTIGVIDAGKNMAGRATGAAQTGMSNLRNGFNAARGKGFAGMSGSLGEAARKTATSSIGGKLGYTGGKLLTPGVVQAGKTALSGAKMFGSAALRMAGPAIEGYMAYNAPTTQNFDTPRTELQPITEIWEDDNNPNVDALSNRNPLANMAMGMAGGGSTTMGDVGARSLIGSMLGVEQGSMADQQLGNFSQLAAGTMAWQGMGVPAPAGAILTTGAMLGQEGLGYTEDMKKVWEGDRKINRMEYQFEQSSQPAGEGTYLNAEQIKLKKEIDSARANAERFRKAVEEGRGDEQAGPSGLITNKEALERSESTINDNTSKFESSLSLGQKEDRRRYETIQKSRQDLETGQKEAQAKKDALYREYAKKYPGITEEDIKLFEDTKIRKRNGSEEPGYYEQERMKMAGGGGAMPIPPEAPKTTTQSIPDKTSQEAAAATIPAEINTPPVEPSPKDIAETTSTTTSTSQGFTPTGNIGVDALMNQPLDIKEDRDRSNKARYRSRLDALRRAGADNASLDEFKSQYREKIYGKDNQQLYDYNKARYSGKAAYMIDPKKRTPEQEARAQAYKDDILAPNRKTREAGKPIGSLQERAAEYQKRKSSSTATETSSADEFSSSSDLGTKMENSNNMISAIGGAVGGALGGPIGRFAGTMGAEALAGLERGASGGGFLNEMSSFQQPQMGGQLPIPTNPVAPERVAPQSRTSNLLGQDGGRGTRIQESTQPMQVQTQGQQEITVRLPDIQALVNQSITGMIYDTVGKVFSNLAENVRSSNNFDEVANAFQNGITQTETKPMEGKK